MKTDDFKFTLTPLVLFLCAAVFICAVLGVSGKAEREDDPNAKYGVITPPEGTYKVTYFSKEQAPIPEHYEVTRIYWIDSDTIIFQPEVWGTDRDKKHTEAVVPIITLDLEGMTKTEITRAVRGFCYDTLTKEITFRTVEKLDFNTKERTIKFKYGVLGTKLKSGVSVSRVGEKANYAVRPSGCTVAYPGDWTAFVTQQGEYMIHSLPRGDGKIGIVTKNVASGDPFGTFLYISPTGEQKKFFFGPSRYGTVNLPKLDQASGEYIMYRTNDDHGITIRRYNKEFDLVSEKTYPEGPWAGRATLFPVKTGYLSYLGNYVGKSFLYLLTHEGKILEVLRDYGLPRLVSVSPNGCGAIFFHQAVRRDPKNSSKLALVSLC